MNKTVGLTPCNIPHKHVSTDYCQILKRIFEVSRGEWQARRHSDSEQSGAYERIPK